MANAVFARLWLRVKDTSYCCAQQLTLRISHAEPRSTVVNLNKSGLKSDPTPQPEKEKPNKKLMNHSC